MCCQLYTRAADAATGCAIDRARSGQPSTRRFSTMTCAIVGTSRAGILASALLGNPPVAVRVTSQDARAGGRDDRDVFASDLRERGVSRATIA